MIVSKRVENGHSLIFRNFPNERADQSSFGRLIFRIHADLVAIVRDL
jgi:hypothetical protein